jgi:hypothetical protein
MKAVFVELPAFARYRADYLDDEGFRALQAVLLADPRAGAVIPGAGGLRKVRFGDRRRGKGRRGGLRVVYFWWSAGAQFWLFTLYDKDELEDLAPGDRARVAGMLRMELEARKRR